MMRRLILTLCLMWLLPVPLWAADNDIRLNSLGFLPDHHKRATIVAPCTTFNLRDAVSDQIVLIDWVNAPITQQDVGQTIRIADFSACRRPGRYVLEVPGVGRSAVFPIGTDVYNQATITAMRGFYLWRCGMAVRGTYQGQVYEHPACHLRDGYQDFLGLNLTGRRDGSGGWHDAGDFGKYTVNAGITLANLMWTWNQFGDRLQQLDLDLPQTAPGLPNFLEDIKWETDWLLKMQYPDGSGRVSHKLTRLNFAGFIMPQDDQEKRFFSAWSSTATADFAASLAMAARVYKPYDPTYAQRCLEAAQLSYRYLQSHPAYKRWQQGEFKTGAYQSSDQDDRLWAAAELWETTGEAACLQDFETRAKAINGGTVQKDWDWSHVRNLGLFTYVLSQRKGRDPNLVQRIRKDVLAVADAIVAHAQQDVYGRPLKAYYWGCNGTIARQTLNLQVAYRLEPKPVYLETALDAVGHLFGRNVYNRSYVTGLGSNPPLHPHDRRSGADGINPPWPGYLVGGGHPGPKDWHDVQADYRTNEIAINWQAALVYALAGFVSP